MAPILLKVKGDASLTQLASLDSEEELSKTWRICTKVKDALQNGIRLENLSWRLWHLHKFLVEEQKKPNGRKRDIKKVCGVTTKKLALSADQAEQATDDSIADMKKERENFLKEKQKEQALKQDMHHMIQLDDFFGSFGATVFLGGLEEGPRLEIPLADVSLLNSDWLQMPLQQQQPAITPMTEVLSLSLSNPQQFLHQNLFQVPQPVTAPFFQSALPSEESFLMSFPTTAIGVINDMQGPMSAPLQQRMSLPEENKEISNGTTFQNVRQKCSNCGVTSTPLWRRAEKTMILCNACGLYYKMHKHNRPLTMKSSTNKKSASFTPPSCFNCKTNNTPLWRKDEESNILCNACGLYKKMHGHHRPVSMKTDLPKKRTARIDGQSNREKRVKKKEMLEEGTVKEEQRKPHEYFA